MYDATKQHQPFFGIFLEMQIPRPHSRLTESDTLAMGPRNLSLRRSCCTLMFGIHNLATQSMICSQYSGDHWKPIRNKEPWAPPHVLRMPIIVLDVLVIIPTSTPFSSYSSTPMQELSLWPVTGYFSVSPHILFYLCVTFYRNAHSSLWIMVQHIILKTITSMAP